MQSVRQVIYLTIGVSTIIVLVVWAVWIRPPSVTSRANSKQPYRDSDPARKIPTPAVTEVRDSSNAPVTIKEVLEGIIQPPAQAEVDAFLQEHGRSQSNLLAAHTLTSDISYLEEALQRFPDNPNVLVAILSQEKPQENAIELAETLTFLEPDNALSHYLHGKALLDVGEIDAAFVALSDGASASSFQATLTEQIEGLTAFHEFQGSSPDLALIQSVFGAGLPHLDKMRKLTQELTIYNSQDDIAVSVGVAMGNHLSQGAGNYLLINQLVGLAIEQQFLESRPPETFNLFLNQTHGELLRDIERQRSHIAKIAKTTSAEWEQMTTEEAAIYARIVMEEGEEAAMRKTFHK